MGILKVRRRHIAAFVTIFGFYFVVEKVAVTGPFRKLFTSIFGHPSIVWVDPLAPDNYTSNCRPLTLRGHENVQTTSMDLKDLELKFKTHFINGEHLPIDCNATSNVAIIIPYRDRRRHLVDYLYNVIPKLVRQNIRFSIFVVEQAPGAHFNRGMMRNVGFSEVYKLKKYDCYLFNDVDTIPENDKNIYKCNTIRARSLVSGVERYGYGLQYPELFGGIVAFDQTQFININGYSNVFFLWGAEDDDIFRRVINAGYMVERPIGSLGYITTLKHKNDPVDYLRHKLYETVESLSHKDGLNSLKYKLIKMEVRTLFTLIYVDVNEDEVKGEVWSSLERGN